MSSRKEPKRKGIVEVENVVLKKVVTNSRARTGRSTPLKGQSINFNQTKENTADAANDSLLRAVSQKTNTIKPSQSNFLKPDQSDALNFNQTKMRSLIMETIDRVATLVKEIESLTKRLIFPTTDNALENIYRICGKYLKLGQIFYKADRFLEELKLYAASFENASARLKVLVKELEREFQGGTK